MTVGSDSDLVFLEQEKKPYTEEQEKRKGEYDAKMEAYLGKVGSKHELSRQPTFFSLITHGGSLTTVMAMAMVRRSFRPPSYLSCSSVVAGRQVGRQMPVESKCTDKF